MNDGHGRCIEIACAWSQYFVKHKLYATPMGEDDDHTTCWVAIGDEVYNVDLPPGFYEHIVAGRWVRFPEVTILADWIVVEAIQGRDRQSFLNERSLEVKREVPLPKLPKGVRQRKGSR